MMEDYEGWEKTQATLWAKMCSAVMRSQHRLEKERRQFEKIYNIYASAKNEEEKKSSLLTLMTRRGLESRLYLLIIIVHKKFLVFIWW